MLIAKSKVNQEKLLKVNLPILITSFVEIDGQVGVEGWDLRQPVGEKKVRAVLTSKGKASENSRRKSFADLQKGFKASGQFYKLEPGGVIVLSKAFPLEDNIYMGTWINVLSYNEKGKSRIRRAKEGYVGIVEKENGNNFGYVKSFFREHQINFSNITNKEKELIQKFYESNIERSPGFLIRALDKDGNVVEYNMFSQNWNKEENRKYTKEEYLAFVESKIQEMAKNENVVEFSLLPSISYTLSKIALDENLDNFKKIMAAYYQENEDGIHVVCQDTWLKMSEDGNFATAFYPVNMDFNSGADPVYIGIEKKMKQKDEVEETEEASMSPRM